MYAHTRSRRVACLQPWILVVWRLLWRINTAVKKGADWSSVMVSSTHSKSAFSEPEPTHLPTHTDAGPSLNYIYTRTNTIYTVGSQSMSGSEPNRMCREKCVICGFRLTESESQRHVSRSKRHIGLHCKCVCFH